MIHKCKECGQEIIIFLILTIGIACAVVVFSIFFILFLLPSEDEIEHEGERT
jgi:hypothetical protein